MTDATAAFYDVPRIDGRVFQAGPGRRLLNGVAVGIGGIGAAAALVASTAVAAVWLAGVTLSTSPHLHVRASIGPRHLALVTTAPPAVRNLEPTHPGQTQSQIQAQVQVAMTAAADASFASKWAGASAFAEAKTVAQPPKPRAAPTSQVPLPRPHPVQMAALREPDPEPAPQIAPQAKPQALPHVAMAAPKPPDHKSLQLPDPDSRTAIYDISARTVFMPNGQKLEAHSGLGDKLDDPRYIKVRMRGPTPPNVYELTMREQLFHGVRAIRLNPVDESKMHGRDGMLAHTYMLGPNGQSNGCVSFKDYNKFLQAFLDGKVERLVVVPDRSDTSWRSVVAQLGPPRAAAKRRYAANDAEKSAPAKSSFWTW